MVESPKTAQLRYFENSSILKIIGRNLVESQRKKVGRNLVDAENSLKTVESLLTKQTE